MLSKSRALRRRPAVGTAAGIDELSAWVGNRPAAVSQGPYIDASEQTFTLDGDGGRRGVVPLRFTELSRSLR